MQRNCRETYVLEQRYVTILCKIYSYQSINSWQNHYKTIQIFVSNYWVLPCSLNLANRLLDKRERNQSYERGHWSWKFLHQADLRHKQREAMLQKTDIAVALRTMNELFEVLSKIQRSIVAAFLISHLRHLDRAVELTK